jgi:endonuclease-3
MRSMAERARLTPNPSPRDIRWVVRTLYGAYGDTMLTRRSPFHVLIATVLSHRTKDEVTHEASTRLFEEFGTPAALAAADASRVAALIRPVGFYNRKAEAVIAVARDLQERFAGQVPEDIEQMCTLPSVGRKTANVVMVNGFGKPAVAVDTHVHRISNRLGWVKTRTPEQTEVALRRVAPRDTWLRINDALVNHGRTVCKPIGPRCSVCPVAARCARVGVRPGRGFEIPASAPAPRKRGRTGGPR